MPTYEYRCKACKHEFELFQSMTAKPVSLCPSCGKKRVERLIGTGAALLFKGSGFYQTDYRTDSYKKGSDAEKNAAETKSDSKSDATPGAKADLKPSAGEKPAPKVEAPAAKPAPAKTRRGKP